MKLRPPRCSGVCVVLKNDPGRVRRPDSAMYEVGTCSGPRAPVDFPPSPKIDPIERKKPPERAKLALTFDRKGAKCDVSDPTAPRQRSCVRLRLKPGSRSLRIELVTLGVVHPEKPGFLACSKS